MVRFRLLALGCVLSGLAACAQPAPVVVPPPPPLALDARAACLQELTSLGVPYQTVQPFGEAQQGCGIDNPVKITGAHIPWNRPAVLSCDLARTLTYYERDVLQPMAQKHFGQAVTQILQAGTYDCRIQRNNSTQGGSKGGRLSEHSKGLALDVAGYRLADGSSISIKNDWRSSGKKSPFLRELARASCSRFQVVLTPNHDKYHQDHFHFDIGPYSLCGI